MNLLITGAWTNKYIDEIEEMGHSVIYMQQEKDPLPCDYDWIEGVICNGLFLHHPISRFINLRYIQLISAGYDRVPMDEVAARKIVIHNARGVYSIPMAEFAIAGVLDLYKNMNLFREQQKRHEWIKNREIRELAGSRVVIVGCGSVGTECAKRFKAFGCNVTGVDAFVREDTNYDSILELDALEYELTSADVVVLTLPLTVETKGIIDMRRINMIHGILVNISRGGVVDQKALEEWKGAAVLDVFEEEPLKPECVLWDKEKTLITPHNSFVSDRNENRLKKLILSYLGDLIDG